MIVARVDPVGYPAVEISWLGAVNWMVSVIAKVASWQSCTTAPLPPACKALLIVDCVPDEMHAADATLKVPKMAKGRQDHNIVESRFIHKG